MIAFATLILAAMLIFAVSAAKAQPQDSAADYCQRGQELLEAGRPLEAREEARHALELEPNSAKAEYLLGTSELALDNRDAAGRHLRKALELKPDFVAARAGLGTLYLKENRLKEARLQFESALSLDASYFQSRYGLGLVFLLDRQPEAALSEFDKADRIKPDDTGLLASLLQAQLQLKQEIQAEATLARLDSQLNSNDPRRMEVAAMLVQEGAFKLASQQFERMVRTQPESYDLKYNLALAYHRAGEEEKAASLLAQMLARQDSAELEALLGDVEEGRANKPQSLAAFRRAAELEPKNEEYRYDYGQALAYWG
jgi:tetratricopeptide (TPR) repeat protein